MCLRIFSVKTINNLFLLIIPFCVFLSCIKTDFKQEAKDDNQIETFLKLDKPAPPELSLITKDLRRQLYKRNFIANFIQWHGAPQWEKAIKLKKTNPGYITLAIPTFKNDELTAFFAATITPNNNVLFEMHRVSAIKSHLKEYSYIGINSVVSNFYLSVFSGNKILLNSPGNNNMVDPCEYCWYEWELCPPQFSKTLKDTTIVNNASIPHDPPPHCWIEYCDSECEPGGDGNGGGGGGGGCPTCPPPPQCDDPFWYSFVPEEDPCDPPPPPPIPIDTCETAHLTAQKMDSLYINGKVDSMLNTMPGWQSLTFEKGFPIYKTYTQNQSTGAVTITGYHPGAVQGNAASASVYITFTIPAGTRAAGQTHIHTDSGFAAPSAGDIYSLIENHNSFNSSNAALRYEGTIVAAFNNSKYAIAITDPTKAALFYSKKSQYLNTATADWKNNSEILLSALSAFNDYYDKYTNYSDTVVRTDRAFEMSQAAVLTEYNSGITLCKRDVSGHFKPIVIDTRTDPADSTKKTYIQKCL